MANYDLVQVIELVALFFLGSEHDYKLQCIRRVRSSLPAVLFNLRHNA